MRLGCAVIGFALVLNLQAQSSIPPPPPRPVDDTAIAFDPPSRTYLAKLGEESATLTFRVLNTSAQEVVIKEVNTSCGCTVPTMPSRPWVLAPGAGGNLDLKIDLRGKTGTLVKTATVETLRGSRVLTFQVVVPRAAMNSIQRERNRQLAGESRQAIFVGDCARCHVAPAAGKTGEALYQAACGICHDAEPRASMVPDLAQFNRPADFDYWKTIIVAGKAGTMMPGFSADMGGPLNHFEINSLAAYLAQKHSPEPPPASPGK